MNQLPQRRWASTLSISLCDGAASAQLVETCPGAEIPQTPFSLPGNCFDKELGFSPSPPKCFWKWTEKEKSIMKTDRLREVSEMLPV